MAIIKVQYKLSAQYIQSVLAKTGDRLPEKNEVEIDLKAITPEQRETLVNLLGLDEVVDASNRNIPGTWSSKNEVRFDQPLTVDAAIGAVVEKFAAVARLVEQQKAEKMESDRLYWEKLAQKEAKDRENRKAAEEAREHQEKAKAQAQADKLAWCAAHGSPHLALAVANGYDCTRLYATERAALEHPGYTVDFDNAGEWKVRSCPSQKALAEALAVGGDVVWMTHPARKDNPDDWQEFEPCEAVVIGKFLGKYDLVRTM